MVNLSVSRYHDSLLNPGFWHGSFQHLKRERRALGSDMNDSGRRSRRRVRSHYWGEQCYLCDLRGGGGVRGLSSEGLWAQQETRRRVWVQVTLKGTNIIVKVLCFKSKVNIEITFVDKSDGGDCDHGSAALTPGASYVNVLLITGTSCQWHNVRINFRT